MTSDRRLLRLLDGPPERLERYLVRHPEAADRLDQLTSLDQYVVGALHRATGPDSEMTHRLTDAFNFDESTRALATTIGDLMALGVRTISALANPNDPPSPTPSPPRAHQRSVQQGDI